MSYRADELKAVINAEIEAIEAGVTIFDDAMQSKMDKVAKFEQILDILENLTPKVEKGLES